MTIKYIQDGESPNDAAYRWAQYAFNLDNQIDALIARLRELRDDPCGLHEDWEKGQRDLAVELLAMLGEE